MIAAMVIFALGLLFKAVPLWARDIAPDTPPDAPTGNMPPLPQQPGGAVQMNDIHDIKPALAVGADFAVWMWVAAGVIVFAILMLAFYIIRRRRIRSNNEQADISKVTPDMRALNDLDALAAESNHLDGKTFYFRLSAVLRTYLEGRYAFAAAEMTTEELLPAVNRLGWSVEMNRSLREFCRATDPIKFANVPARRDRVASDLAYVRQLVVQTRITEEEKPLDKDTSDDETQPETAAALTDKQVQLLFDDKPSENPKFKES